MPINIDELQIEINAKAVKANDAIDKLVSKLDVLSTSLGRIDGSKITGLAHSVDRLGRAMQVMNTVKTTDFTRLATNIQKLSNINTAGLNNSASALSQITRAFNNLGAVSGNAQQVGELASNLSRLGYKSVTNAITNIPQLAAALDQLLITLSRSPRVSQNIIDMTNALANLSAQSRSVGTASNAIVNGMNNTDRAMRKSSKSAKSLASAFGRFYASYFLVVRGIKSLYGSIESTADYIEAYNYYNVAFGKIASEWSQDWEKYGYENAESYSESFTDRMNETLGKLSGIQIDTENNLLTDTGLKNLGLNIQEITQYASQLASVTNSLGQTGESTLAITQSMTKLAGDISSLFNIDYSTVAKNLQSGLIGQSRALYKYGIDITNATLQTYAYELGLEKSVSEMTQMEKQQLRVLAILEQSKVSWGDLANTIESPSNMMRQLTTNIREAGMVLGQLFIPLMSKILPLANGATIALKRLLVQIAGFFGVEIDFESFGQGYNDLEDDLGNITDGYEDLTVAVKEYQNQLLGFDEVTKLSEDTSIATGDVTGGEIDLTDEIVSATEEYKRVWNEAFANMENSSLKWADAIGGGFGKLAEYLDPLTDFTSENLENFYNSFLSPLGSWTLGTGLPRLSEIVKDFMDDVDWDNLALGLDKFYKAVEPFAEGFGEGFLDFINAMADIGAGGINFFGGLLNVVGDAAGKADTERIRKLGEVLGILAGSFLLYKTLEGIGKIADDIKTSFYNMGNKLQKPNWSLIATGVSVLATALITWRDSLVDSSVSGKFLDSTEDIIRGLENIEESARDGILSIDAEHDYYSEMAEKYYDLSQNYEGLTSTERELLKKYADELSQYTTGENSIQSMVDEVTGAWTGTKSALEDAIDAQNRFYKEALYQDVMKEYELESIKLGIQLEANEDQLINNADSILEAMRKDVAFSAVFGLNAAKVSELEALRDLGDTSEYVKGVYNLYHLYAPFIGASQPWRAGELADQATEFNTAYEAWVKASEKYVDAQEELSKIKGEIFKLSVDDTELTELKQNIAEYTENLTDINSTSRINVNTQDAQISMSRMKDIFETYMGKMKNSSTIKVSVDTSTFVKDASSVQTMLNNTIPNQFTIGIEIEDNEFIKGLKSLKTEWENTINDMNSRGLSLGTKGGMGNLPIGLIGALPFGGAYAGGGFVSAGQIFVAREAGPELVGTMGGRTAVANNDQIVQGIAQAVAPAVYNAVVSAMQTTANNSGSDIVVNIDGKQVFKAVQRQASNYTAQTGKSAFVV